MNFKVEKSDMKGDAGMAHIQTESEWEIEMCGKIVAYLAGKRYVDMRYMEPVLNVLGTRENTVSYTHMTLPTREEG